MVVAVVALLILILGAILFPGFVKGLLYTLFVVIPGAFVMVFVAEVAPPEYVAHECDLQGLYPDGWTFTWCVSK